MNQTFHSRAFTLVELLIVMVVILVLASILFPVKPRARSKAVRIACVNNLKQIGIAYRVWSSDHGDMVPTVAPATMDGLRETFTNKNQGINCWMNYLVMSNELGFAPRTLVCPSDQRNPATDFTTGLNNTTVSYFVGVGAGETFPNALVGGDRNLGPSSAPYDNYGYSPADGRGNDVTLRTNSPVCWSQKIHTAGNPAGAGNILLGDGSVYQVSNARFRSDYQPFAGTPDADSTNLPAPSFRLLFP